MRADPGRDTDVLVASRRSSGCGADDDSSEGKAFPVTVSRVESIFLTEQIEADRRAARQGARGDRLRGARARHRDPDRRGRARGGRRRRCWPSIPQRRTLERDSARAGVGRGAREPGRGRTRGAAAAQPAQEERRLPDPARPGRDASSSWHPRAAARRAESQTSAWWSAPSRDATVDGAVLRLRCTPLREPRRVCARRGTRSSSSWCLSIRSRSSSRSRRWTRARVAFGQTVDVRHGALPRRDLRSDRGLRLADHRHAARERCASRRSSTISDRRLPPGPLREDRSGCLGARGRCDGARGGDPPARRRRTSSSAPTADNRVESASWIETGVHRDGIRRGRARGLSAGDLIIASRGQARLSDGQKVVTPRNRGRHSRHPAASRRGRQRPTSRGSASVSRFDLFIRRPVLTWMLIAVTHRLRRAGLQRGWGSTSSPTIEFPVVTEWWPSLEGASPKVVEEDVTDILEEYDQHDRRAFARSRARPPREGRSIRVPSSSSAIDIDVAAQDVRDKIAQARFQLPRGRRASYRASRRTSANGAGAVDSDPVGSAGREMVDSSEFVRHQVKPRLETIPGVAGVGSSGDAPGPRRSASGSTGDAAPGARPRRELTSIDAMQARARRGSRRARSRASASSTRSRPTPSSAVAEAELERLVVILAVDGSPVRLEDVARVEDGAEDLQSASPTSTACRPSPSASVSNPAPTRWPSSTRCIDRLEQMKRPSFPVGFQLQGRRGLLDSLSGSRWTRPSSRWSSARCWRRSRCWSSCGVGGPRWSSVSRSPSR